MEKNAGSPDRLEGRNPVIEALRAGRTINKIWVQKREGRPDPVMARIVRMARDAGIVMIELEKTALDQMAESHGHQGVIAQVAAHEYIDLDEHIDKLIEDGKQPFVIILDSLKESYNLGSVLRIADAAGVDAVVIPERRSVALDATVAKASAGAVEYVSVARVNNLTNTVLKLKEKGFWIAGTDADATQMYWEADWKGPMAIVVGSEGEGISKGLLGHCDFLVSIPMSGEVNSLNAAVATGIIVFEAVKQRRS
ncbi:MAG: 23S rRNA (guanosine(2251)-2'-O)-methyltransferase RlmB [Eubacteriales bacterium]|nr:23S rRNA (guanosine(2251)-2'-O)-methyltransferase RlmB [Eubacteriales bacterium]MDD3196716.1 23S rRNA (guanosine(2251)-2'-O)-methyltransferase RlmB [Eubacteriales bacterium]